MQCINLKDARVDMILAADVDHTQQMPLLKKGTRLTAPNLRMLKSWGIERLCVELPANGETDNAARTVENGIDLEQEILSRFTGAAEDPMVKEICRAAAEILHARVLGPKE